MTTHRVWHGTCKQWKRFDLRAGNPRSACGRGYYFSDCIDDAVSYSVKSHPDNKDKIMDKKYELIDKGLPYHTAEKKAERVYNTSRLLECELVMKKPLEFWKEGSSVWVERKSFKRLTKVLAGYREDAYSLDSGYKLIDALVDGVNTSELYSLMVNCGVSAFPQLVRALGYDSCIMHNTLEWWPRWYQHQANHYIVYNRGQIKINNDTQPIF